MQRATEGVTIGRTEPRRGDRDTQLRGWRTFAGIIFYLVGAFNVIGGLAAIFKEEFFLVDGEKLLVTDYTAWGWFLHPRPRPADRRRRHPQEPGMGTSRGRRPRDDERCLHIAFLVAFPIFRLITISLCIAVVYGLVVGPDPDEGRV